MNVHADDGPLKSLGVLAFVTNAEAPTPAKAPKTQAPVVCGGDPEAPPAPRMVAPEVTNCTALTSPASLNNVAMPAEAAPANPLVVCFKQTDSY